MKKLLVVLVVLATSLIGVSQAATSPKQTSGVAYVNATHGEGPSLYVAGDVKDKLFRRGAILFVTTGKPRPSNGDGSIVIDVTAKRVTVFTTRGTLTGTGSGVQTFNQDGTTYIIGKFTLSKG